MKDWRDHYPDPIGPAEAFARFEELSARILKDENPVVIAAESGDVVLMSAAEYRSTMETLYLFSTPANAKWLIKGLEEAKRGEAEPFAFERRQGQAEDNS
ncbi:type II toxin-antitoxin system Phd/YefM family antitoxin [Rhodococcoides kyotonense]|uniref:Antitoxin n=1 Tax=Rhodococcoides kyotonense TaxID=398843 RepID=A0A239INZ2_9NOCA|nr:type II toxin-antitoxin system Phd/YefM family antitoxin [Rhodococcus kyotonensis]SNS94783.1 antitoxin YefM [Rhodococcus kyotonensis]